MNGLVGSIPQSYPANEKSKTTKGFVEVMGAKIHYLRKGRGSTQVLIDGWGGSSDAFNRIIPYLTKNHECIIIDYPGFGISSEFPNEQHTIANYSKMVIGVMDRLGIKRAGLIGDSMGGMVALELGSKNPERFEYLVIQGTPDFPKKMQAMVERLPSKYLDKLYRSMQKIPLLIRILRWLNPEFSRMTTVERRRNVKRIVQSSSRAVIESLKDMASYDLKTVASEVSVPVLIVEGAIAARSPISSVKVLRDNSKVSEIKLIPGASHTVLLQKPREFAEAVLDFAKKWEGAVG